MAQKLTVDDGVVVKFGPAAGMTVKQKLQTGRHVVFTSLQDDSAANQTGMQPGSPTPGDWRGLAIQDSVEAENLHIDRLAIRYAGADGAAALDVGQDYAIQFLDLTHNLLGIRVLGGAQPTFTGLSLSHNRVGLESREESSPVMSGADVSGNVEYGVLNLTPQTLVQATGSWWGDATGPQDPVENPSGAGDTVSTGVNYGSFSTTMPLIDCSLAPADGIATVATPTVSLALECRNATEYRLALDGDFGSAPYEQMSTSGPTTTPFLLTGAAGDRAITVEYRATTLNVTTASLVLHYQPGAPHVTITSPEPDAVLTTDTTIAATVSDAAGIDHVDFLVDGGSTPIATDTSAPYETIWSIEGVSSGQHEITVLATSTSGQTGQAVRQVTVQHPGNGDTEGPIIDDVAFEGQLIVDQTTVLTGPGTITFTASDPSDISEVLVTFDQIPLTVESTGGTNYAAALDLTGIADGPHVLTIDASDGAGNPSELVLHVTVDTSGGAGAPVVTITAPADGVPVTGTTTVSASVEGSDIASVEFSVDGAPIGTDNQPPYDATWDIAGLADGTSHTIIVVATNAEQQTGQASRTVTVQRDSNDTTGPAISNIRFAGQPLADGATLAAPGLLTFQVADDSGVASGAVKVGDTPIPGGGINNGQYSTLLDFDVIANGSYDISVSAVDTVGNPSEQIVHNIEVAVPAPPVPVVLVPTNGTVTPQPTIAVSGTAQAGTSIQLQLDGNAAGSPVTTAFNGSFNTTLTLPDEGTHALTVTATNSRGTSPASTGVSIAWSAPSPTVVISSPPADAVLDSDGEVGIDASIVDPVGISAATLKIDGQPFGQTLSAAPYSWVWNVGTVSEGTHQIEVSALNVVGKSASATRSVSVVHTPPPPPPVQTAYTGHVDSISPAASYGDQPIVITGSAVDRASGAVVPNALLKIVLQINGFQRRIGTSTNTDGQFSYTFIPQDSDAGVYVVSVIHPDETDLVDQGQFSINRLSLKPTRYNLNAARTIASTIRITASASDGQGASGVHLTAIPGQQPSGSLPVGITIDTPSPVDVPGGGSARMDVVFTAGTASEAPDPNGSVVLTAIDGSGRERGSVVINYTLSEPQPYLLPQPSSIQTGVSRGNQVIETVKLNNKGLRAASNVQVALGDFKNAQNQPVDTASLVYLSSPGDLGEMAVGATQTVQIVAAPESSVADNVYTGKLHVTADGIDGFVWISIAVTSADRGGIKFLAKDIYTCIPDCASTPGLGGASISVQNEAVPSIVKRATTATSGDAQGQAEIPDLPVGHYRYVATASSHVTATGRITVQPGISVSKDVFLDYQLVTFEWSVTETTIEDQYDVALTATYEAQVPAPVVLIQPGSINLPNMQAGEEITGEVTITNYGLVRADNVVWKPAVSDQYYDVEFLGEPPESLAAHQSVRLPYRITKTCTPLPGTQASGSCSPLTAQTSAGQAGTSRTATGRARSPHPGHVAMSRNTAASTTGGTCHSYHNPMSVTTSYQCASGDQRNTSASAGFNKAYGQCSTGGGGGSSGGNGGPPVGGWGGGSGGGPAGTPMSSGPGCVPECPDCKGSSPGN